MSNRSILAVLAAILFLGCASNRDFVQVTPVQFIPVVGAGGPSCQGWCPTSPIMATTFRVEVGNATFRRIVEEAKAQGKDGDLTFLDFAKNEVKAQGYCPSAELTTSSSKQPISSVEGWSVFWTDITCSEHVQNTSGNNNK